MSAHDLTSQISHSQDHIYPVSNDFLLMVVTDSNIFSCVTVSHFIEIFILAAHVFTIFVFISDKVTEMLHVFTPEYE